MTTDFRALCAELVEKVEFTWGSGTPEDVEELLTRARAALAREPAAGEPAAVAKQPSDEAWDALVERAWGKYQTVGYQGERFMYDRDFDNALEFVRQGLARWGNPAPQLEGKVPLPSNADQAALMVILGEQWLSANAPERLRRQASSADGEVAELVQHLRHAADADAWNGASPEWCQSMLRAAELLQRLSPPQPVPVSERPPGPKDCDAKGRCWWGRSESDDWSADWTLATHEVVAEFCEFSPQTVWLPAHALPVPQQQENTND